MTNKQYIEKLRKLCACLEAIEWVDNRDLATSWSACDRGDWMVWLAIKAKVDLKVVVRVCCQIARTALYLIPVGEDRPRIAIETAERWVRGEATIDEVRPASLAVYGIYDSLNSVAANYAVYSIYSATAAVFESTYSYGTYAVYAAAAAADSANNRRKSLKESAEIVRETITAEMIEEALGISDEQQQLHSVAR